MLPYYVILFKNKKVISDWIIFVELNGMEIKGRLTYYMKIFR